MISPSQPSRALLLVVLPHMPHKLGTVQSADMAGSTRKKIKSFLAFPYGVLTLASYIKRYAASLRRTEILDLNLPAVEDPVGDFKAKLAEIKPEIVGFSMSYDASYEWLKILLDVTKEYNKDIYTVAGGPAVTTAYKEILEECPNLDAGCYSEGEVALKSLLEAEDISVAIQQDPWATREKLAARKTIKPVYDDLDKIVDVDYDLVDVNAYSMREAFSPFTKFTKDSKQFFIVTSRGCPFKCVFCAEPSFHGANMRYVTVDNAIDHLKKVQEKYGLTTLTIYDDQILMKKDRAKEFFSKLIPLKIRVEMPNGVTLSYIDEEMAAVMKQAGVDTIFLAIEHGSKRVLKDIIRKPISFARIGPTVALLQEAGIYCQGFFVIGLPGETRSEREETREIIQEWGLDWASFGMAAPLRGSELFRMCKEKGWLSTEDLKLGNINMQHYCIKAPGMDKDEIENFVFDANLYCNFVNNRNMKVGNYKVGQWVFREVVDRFPTQAFAHYYLSKAMDNLGEDGNEHYAKYLELITTIPKWNDAAIKFGLEKGFGRDTRQGTELGLHA
jgi:anaerobic magnesium-protoporphyrin IX monomethyl ester cyclase